MMLNCGSIHMIQLLVRWLATEYRLPCNLFLIALLALRGHVHIYDI